LKDDSLPVPSQIEVLDLRHYSARQLRPLLEREARVWRDRLRWNYDSSIELLLEYLESRILPGFVALDRGRVCGYIFCVYEGRKAVIGDAFAYGHRTLGDVETTRILLVHMLEMLRHTPGVERIESQLLLFDAGDFATTVTAPEFTVFPRLFLERDLRFSPAAPTPRIADTLDISRWLPQDYEPVAELIFASYKGHRDAEINDQYRTMHGSLRFLHNIVRFPGCGVFEPAHSWLLRERGTGTLAGLILCSRVGRDVAHVTQLCVAQRYRGQALGRALLEQSAASLARAGYAAMTLTVTEANEPAVSLYRNSGFLPRHRFDAMVLETQPARL
jgi:ribosomal protein S18 acetylase RimI-like enzyme